MGSLAVKVILKSFVEHFPVPLPGQALGLTQPTLKNPLSEGVPGARGDGFLKGGEPKGIGRPALSV